MYTLKPDTLAGVYHSRFHANISIPEWVSEAFSVLPAGVDSVQTSVCVQSTAHL